MTLRLVLILSLSKQKVSEKRTQPETGKELAINCLTPARRRYSDDKNTQPVPALSGTTFPPTNPTHQVSTTTKILVGLPTKTEWEVSSPTPYSTHPFLRPMRAGNRDPNTIPVTPLVNKSATIREVCCHSTTIS
jgi:hypothetical protein